MVKGGRKIRPDQIEPYTLTPPSCNGKGPPMFASPTKNNEIIHFECTTEEMKRQFEPPCTKSSAEKQQKCGKLGKPIQIQANHFPLDIKIPNGDIYHYDVTFILPNKAEVKKSHKSLLIKVIEKVKEQYQSTLGNPNSIVFDGLKNLYSNRELFQGLFEGTVKINDGKDSPRFIEVGVRLKRVGNSLPVNYMVSQYLQSGRKGAAIHDSLQVLNIILGMTPLLHYECVGRTHFNPCTGNGSILEIGHGKSIWVGTFQSARIGWKPFLNIAVANRPAYNQQPVIQFLMSVLSSKDPRCLSNLHPKDKTKLDREIKQLKVRFTRPDGQKREYRVNKLVDSAERLSLDMDSPDGGKRKTTIQQYFKNQYKCNLKYPSLPCAHVGPPKGTIYLPIEFLEIKKQLAPTTKKLSEDETAEMIKQTALQPNIRKQRIQRNLRELKNSFKDDPYAKAFGLEINDKMAEMRGRVLDAPSIKYKKGSKVSECRHTGGKWNMTSQDRVDPLKFLETVSLGRWGVLDLAGLPPQQKQAFVDAVAIEAGQRGHHIDYPIYDKADVNNLEDVEKSFKRLCMHIQQQCNGKPQLVLVIAPFKGNIYPCIKYIGDAVMNVPTQFVLKKNVLGKPRQGPSGQTIHNLCLKLNAKTGGTNHGLFVRPPVMKKPIIILGADVTHSAPSEFKKPSIAAMVGSCNPEASEYFCEVRVQKQGKVMEEIEKTEEMVKSLLQRFNEKTRVKPLKIIYYRDGVSEGQFISVLNHELTAIRKACLSLHPDYKPEVTFFVAQKRHNTRLFPSDPKDGFGKARNVPPGTVIDTMITHPTETDFFLASHEGIQGTTKPTHYHLLWDDSNFSNDELQSLTYNLCHLCSRCERSVSYPAPTYYAHLAAARAREHHNALLLRNRNRIDFIPKEDLRKIEKCTLLNYFM